MKNRVTSLPEDRTASQLYRANHFDLCCESRSANESIKLLVRADGFKLRRRVAVHGRALNKRHSSSLFSRVALRTLTLRELCVVVVVVVVLLLLVLVLLLLVKTKLL